MRACAASMFSFHKRASLVAFSFIASDSCFSRFAVSSAAVTLASNACSSRLRVSSASSAALVLASAKACSLSTSDFFTTLRGRTPAVAGCPPSSRLCSLVAAGALTAGDKSRVSPRASVVSRHFPSRCWLSGPSSHQVPCPSARGAIRRWPSCCWPVDAVVAAGLGAPVVGARC